MYLEIRLKIIVVISCNDMFKNENEKGFRLVVKIMILGRVFN